MAGTAGVAIMYMGLYTQVRLTVCSEFLVKPRLLFQCKVYYAILFLNSFLNSDLIFKAILIPVPELCKSSTVGNCQRQRMLTCQHWSLLIKSIQYMQYGAGLAEILSIGRDLEQCGSFTFNNLLNTILHLAIC